MSGQSTGQDLSRKTYELGQMLGPASPLAPPPQRPVTGLSHPLDVAGQHDVLAARGVDDEQPAVPGQP
jgi:hypothetical protein